jgi:hypothetical protein
MTKVMKNSPSGQTHQAVSAATSGKLPWAASAVFVLKNAVDSEIIINSDTTTSIAKSLNLGCKFNPPNNF